MTSVADLFVVYGLSRGGGMVRYVGLTTIGATARLHFHKQSAERGSKFLVHEWIRENPSLVQITTLEICMDLTQLREREKFWIRELSTHAVHGGLNMTAGGQGRFGYIPTNETREKISRSKKANPPVLTPETRKKYSDAAKKPRGYNGSPKSDTTKAKIAASLQGQNIAGHTRWHLNRGIHKPGCAHCEATFSGEA